MKKTTFLKTMLLLCALVAGSGSVWAADGDVIFHETFDDANGTGANDGQWSGSIAGSAYSKDGWTFAKPYKGDRCLKLATGSAVGSLQTPSISFASGKTYTLIFRAAAWQGDETALKVSYGGTTVVASLSLTQSQFNIYTYTLNPTGAAALTQGSTSPSTATPIITS